MEEGAPWACGVGARCPVRAPRGLSLTAERDIETKFAPPGREVNSEGWPRYQHRARGTGPAPEGAGAARPLGRCSPDTPWVPAGQPAPSRVRGLPGALVAAPRTPRGGVVVAARRPHGARRTERARPTAPSRSGRLQSPTRHRAPRLPAGSRTFHQCVTDDKHTNVFMTAPSSGPFLPVNGGPHASVHAHTHAPGVSSVCPTPTRENGQTHTHTHSIALGKKILPKHLQYDR